MIKLSPYYFRDLVDRIELLERRLRAADSMLFKVAEAGVVFSEDAVEINALRVKIDEALK